MTAILPDLLAVISGVAFGFSVAFIGGGGSPLPRRSSARSAHRCAFSLTAARNYAASGLLDWPPAGCFVLDFGSAIGAAVSPPIGESSTRRSPA